MADRNDAYSRLVRILIGPLEVDFALVSPEATLSELRLDSLAAEEFVLLVAEEFGGDGSAPYDLGEVPLAELATRLAGAGSGAGEPCPAVTCAVGQGQAGPDAAEPSLAGHGGAGRTGDVGRVSG
ncbi:acyl carrier protein [Streptomyces sp. NPDC091272]|uniref:acyl carrier protein n=1 Tax=Streptomyces sp. NPDC091272 TaxID=3365981 RepID=UPI00381E66C4